MKNIIVVFIIGCISWYGFTHVKTINAVPPIDKKVEVVFLPKETLTNSVKRTKRALVIGVGKQEDKNWTKINGDKDVFYVQRILGKAGYTDVHTLVNEQATKAAVVAAFKKLTIRCVTGDIVYIHFSGHGQQVTDTNGDEIDGWDEAWITYDAYLRYGSKDKGEKHLIDDEVNILLTGIRKKIGDSGKLLVVVDACHSGDSSRGDENEIVRGVKDEFVIPTRKIGRSAKAPERWITLSACEDYQLNQEMATPKVGKLTYALYSISQKKEITMEAIVQFMQKNRGRYPQNPILTGETSKYKLSDFLR